MKNPLVRWLLLLLALSPALLPLWQIFNYGIDVPYWDQFDDDLAGIHLKAADGELTFADLAAQHNEHRILVPRLCYLVLGSLTKGNVFGEMLGGWAVAVATSIALFQLGRAANSGKRPSDTRGNPTAESPLWWWFLGNLLVFAPSQWENWLWGMGLANLQPVLWTSLALVAASSAWREGVKVTAVIVFCTLATYASGNGMLSWGLAGVVLLWEPTFRGFLARKRVALLLLVATVLIVATYFHGMAPANHRGLQPYDSTLAAKLHYALVFAGNPFAFALALPPAPWAATIGAVLYVLLAACCLAFLDLWLRRKETALCRRLLPWFAVAGFAVGSAIIAASSRAGIGPAQALSSRYTSFALYLPVALIQLIPPLWANFVARHKTWAADDASGATSVTYAQVMLPVLATLLVVLSLASIPRALLDSTSCERSRRQTRAIVSLLKVLPDHPLITAVVFPDLAVAQRNVTGLDRLGYLRPKLLQSPLAAQNLAPQPPPAEHCGQLEQVWESSPGVLALTGWAALPQQGRTADLVVLCVQDQTREPFIVDMVLVGAPRPDKATALKNPRILNCGWAVQVDVRKLSLNRGPTTVTAWAMDSATGLLYPLNGTARLDP